MFWFYNLKGIGSFSFQNSLFKNPTREARPCLCRKAGAGTETLQATPAAWLRAHAPFCWDTWVRFRFWELPWFTAYFPSLLWFIGSGASEEFGQDRTERISQNAEHSVFIGAHAFKGENASLQIYNCLATRPNIKNVFKNFQLQFTHNIILVSGVIDWVGLFKGKNLWHLFNLNIVYIPIPLDTAYF